MTAVPQERPLPQPQSKAPPTVQSSHPDIVATKRASTLSTPPRARVIKHRQNAVALDYTSRSATLALIRRTLTTDTSQSSGPGSTPQPIENTLPPLTSSNEIDLQLYAIVAIIVKDFVSTWYSKITPDYSFVDEVLQIVAHCSRALEQRIRHADSVEVFLDEVSVLLERHVTSYRIATSSLAHQSYNVDPGLIYHTLNPHPALDLGPDVDHRNEEFRQSSDESTYHQLLVNGTLATLLPSEDLQNASLRILVGDIIADLILGQAVVEKVCEGWFIHNALTKAIGMFKEASESTTNNTSALRNTRTRLEKFGLVHAEPEATRSPQSAHKLMFAAWFWGILQWVYLAVAAVWFVMQGLLQARHLPHRSRPPSSTSSLKDPLVSSPSCENDLSPRPVLAYHISTSFSTLFRLQDRMPWVASIGMFCQHVLLVGSGRLAATNSLFDRFLHHTLDTYVFNSTLVIKILLGLRTTVFPNNALGPPALPPPSTAEQGEIRRQAAKAVLSLIPDAVAHQFFNAEDEEDLVRQIEEDVLDVFSDKYMNKHFLYAVLELVLVRLVPELREFEIRELFARRGIEWGDGVELEDDAENLADRPAGKQ